MRVSEIDLAYIAGFFDGEGCVAIDLAKHAGINKQQLTVTIVNTYKPLIDELHSHYGGSIMESNGRFIAYRLCWRSRKAARFLQDVLPYLKIKRAEAELALEFQAHISSGVKGRLVTSESASYRERCAAKMKALKFNNRVLVARPI